MRRVLRCKQTTRRRQDGLRDRASSRSGRCTETQGRYGVQIYLSIEDVNGVTWDEVVHNRSLFLQRNYLRSIESGTDDQLKLRYALFSEGVKPVGVACFQITDFVGKPIGPLLDRNTPSTTFLARKLGLTQQPFAFKMIVCGSAFSSGEHSFAFLPTATPQAAVHSLVEAVSRIQLQQDAQEGFTGVLFKEFYPSSEPVVGLLKNYSYSDLATEPNMVLFLDPDWGRFDQYLNSLSSKYRIKAKRAYAKSAGLVARDLSIEDLIERTERMEKLYASVLDRADYRLGKLQMKALLNLRRNLGEEFILKGYHLGNELVGFLSGFVDGDTLEAFLVGIDYRLNRGHAIYPRMLYDYLQIALDRGLCRINYGRTAGEIKSTIGAVPVNMKCYIRHRRSILNRLLPALSRRVRPTAFPLRKPFKKAWYLIDRGWGVPELGPPREAHQ